MQTHILSGLIGSQNGFVFVSAKVFYFYPYPGTGLYNLCLENNLIDPDKMQDVSGYREKPVVKMTVETKKSCIRSQQKLLLYFLSRRILRILHIDYAPLRRALHYVLMIWPPLFIDIFTQDSILKRIARKLQYKHL